MIRRWIDHLAMRRLTRRFGEGWPMFGWELKDGPRLDLGIKRDAKAEELLRSVNTWSFMAPTVDLPPDYQLPSTAPITENPDAWVVAPEPTKTEADNVVGLEFAGVNHLIKWCATHNRSPGIYGELPDCKIVDAILRRLPDDYYQ